MSTYLDKEKIYTQYAYDVLEGRINASKAVKKAAQRYLDWFNREDIYFDYETVDKYIRFVGKLKHFTGQFNGKPFILMPWQQFCFANIFGWKWVSTGFRVTKKVFLFMARKNSKTSTCAAFSIIGALIDNEPHAEIGIVANNARQAGICFDQITNYTKSIDPTHKIFKTYRHNINVPLTNSVIEVHSSDSMGLDGHNKHFAINDEFHSQKDWGLYNVLMSSMAMRNQPLMITITTAGFLVGEAYPCYSMYVTCKQILDGIKEDDTQFAMIYELDEEDDWEDESTWIKCSPSLGEIVRVEYMREQLNDAKNNPTLEVGVKTKTFNMWCQAANIWLSIDKIHSVMEEVNLEDYAGENAWMGVDLSVVQDLTTFSVCIPPNPDRKINPDKFVFKTFTFIPEEAFETSSNKEIYKEWRRSGIIEVTSGNVVDYEYILKRQLEVSKILNIIEVEYDSYNATSWAIQAENEGLPLTAFSQTLSNFNRGTKFLAMLVLSKKCIIDKNIAVDWMFSNVEIMVDHAENEKPTKANGDKTRKIDAVISMIEGLGGHLVSNWFQPEMFIIK